MTCVNLIVVTKCFYALTSRQCQRKHCFWAVRLPCSSVCAGRSCCQIPHEWPEQSLWNLPGIFISSLLMTWLGSGGQRSQSYSRPSTLERWSPIFYCCVNLMQKMLMHCTGEIHIETVIIHSIKW